MIREVGVVGLSETDRLIDYKCFLVTLYYYNSWIVMNDLCVENTKVANYNYNSD